MAKPFEKTYRLALYQSCIGTVDIVMVSEYFGADDATSHSKGVMRISEPVEIVFQPLSPEAAREIARASLDEEEQRLTAEINTRLKSIREKRANLETESTEPVT